jgi:branched-chain amino acid transport system permease protein
MTALQYIIDAIALGSIYALVAVGLALIFGVLRLVNFAQGEMITAAAYALYLTASWPKPASLIVSLLVAVVLALLMELIVFRRLRYASPATALVTTFAVAFALEAVWLIAFGPQGKSADVLSSLNQTATHGSLHIRWVTIAMLGAGAVLLGGTGLLLNRTRIGLEMRAAAADFRAARLLGVRANRVIGVAFVLGGLFAGVVALLLTASQPLVTPTFGLQVTILALVGVVVGGIDRLVPATLGGFFIGFANSMLGDVLPTAQGVYVTSFLYLLVIIVLVARPGGLFAPGGSGASVERV